MNSALVGSIERFAVHDGPGIRTTVFFKGCALRCSWCHNPELISPFPETAFHAVRCIGCGECASACPEGAIDLEKVGRVDRARCTVCGKCVAVCPGGAIELVGRNYEVPELIEILLRDRVFYETSGGGVTLSGGEPAYWIGFLETLLSSLKDQGIHTAIQTSGVFDWQDFERLLPMLDLVLFDAKAADPALHLLLTGASNTRILSNLAHLIALRPKDLVVRVPLIPGYTATEKNITEIAALLRKLGVRRCSLLPYHPFGLSKPETIGRSADVNLPRSGMAPDEVEKWRRSFEGMELIDY